MGLLGKGKRDTNSIGDISEAAIITRLLQLGYVVLTPYGRNQRYDLVIEDAEGEFWCVQCKTARIQDSGTVVAFDTGNHNMVGKKKDWRHYRGNAITLRCTASNSRRSTSFQSMMSAPPGQIFD